MVMLKRFTTFTRIPAFSYFVWINIITIPLIFLKPVFAQPITVALLEDTETRHFLLKPVNETEAGEQAENQDLWGIYTIDSDLLTTSDGEIQYSITDLLYDYGDLSFLTPVTSQENQLPSNLQNTQQQCEEAPSGRESDNLETQASAPLEQETEKVPYTIQLSLLEREHKYHLKRLQCRICRKERIASISLPCGHVVLCKQCADDATQCPIPDCRQSQIQAIADIYLN